MSGLPAEVHPKRFHERPTLPEPFKAALERLIKIAQSDTGQSRHCANFLLAWWNASENGGFDFVELWAVDTEIAQDMVSVIRIIAACHCYPDTLGYKKEFQNIWRRWRAPGEDEFAPTAEMREKCPHCRRGIPRIPSSVSDQFIHMSDIGRVLCQAQGGVA